MLPVYRTYVNDREPEVSEQDRTLIGHAVREAKRRNPNRPGAVYDFVRDLLLKKADYIPDSERAEHMDFVARFQQVTSPVTAKGIEDTALYIYNRLVSLNDVGSEPVHFGVAPDALHKWMTDRFEHSPHALSATSTHDTKRSEDVRARIKSCQNSRMRGSRRRRAGHAPTAVDGQPLTANPTRAATRNTCSTRHSSARGRLSRWMPPGNAPIARASSRTCTRRCAKRKSLPAG